MKAFLQSSMTILLGLCLLYAFYQKKMERPQVVLASDIEMDSLFLVDQQAIANKQQVIYKPDIESILPVEPLNKRDSISVASATATDLKKKQKLKPKIEIYELKKSPKSSLANSQLPDSKLTKVISSQLNETTSEETASVSDANTTTESVTEEQPQAEKKKKFLFFNKRNRNN